MFVDRVTIYARGGDGGAGVASFHRRKGKPRGKPNGGSGGKGGAVFVVADAGVATLLAYQRNPHRRAGDGDHGEGDFRHGKHGSDLMLAVPPGTVVRDADGTIVADLVEPGQQVEVAPGGRGGRGNAAFVSAGHKAPSFAEQGEFGEERPIVLELKLIADAALIGFPNAGKSTFISRVSAAKPKVADYPFTTLEPHLGVVSLDDHEFVLADIPGLVEGAAAGRGLGLEFLRHTERARALVVLLDPSPLQEASPLEQHRVLLAELAAHSPDLAARPRVVAVNKADLPDADEAVAGCRAELGEVHAVSAVTGDGVRPLLYAIVAAVEQAARAAPDREGFVLHRPVQAGFTVSREGEAWVVGGRAAERAVAFADLTVPEAADLAAARLTRLGVDDALIAAGALAGDEVRIGDVAFEFQPDGGVAEEEPA